MAVAKIGAKIGVEGYSEFNKTLNGISADLRELQSEMKLIEAEYTAEGNAIKYNKQKREELQKSVEKLEQKYRQELDGINLLLEGRKKLTEQYENGELTRAEYERALEKSIKQEQQFRIASNETATQLINTRNELDNTKTSWELYGEKLKEIGNSISSFGETFTNNISKPIQNAFKSGVQLAIDYESAFTGVKKTTNASKEELEDLNKELKKIPLQTASTYLDVAKVAEQAGQLNIPVDQIAEFSKYIIMLADSTNIAADDGAVNMAKFLNIFNADMTNAADVTRRLGSVFVALGNNFATDEQSLMNLSTRLASAAHLIGLTEADTLALAAAMSSMGLTAEAGGTAMSQTMKAMSEAVARGGEKLELFAEITGQSAEQFAEKFRTKPMEAIQDFLIGLSNLEGGSEALILMLDDLGFSGIRQSDTLQRLASNTDLLTNASKMANEAFEEGDALSGEASQRYEDLASKISQAKEAIKLVALELGESLKPYIEKATEKLKEFAEWWGGLSDGTKKAITKFGLVLAIGGPIIKLLGSLTSGISGVVTMMGDLAGKKGIEAVTTAIGGGSSGMIAGVIKLIGKLGSSGGGLVSGLTGAIGKLTGSGGLVSSLGSAILSVAKLHPAIAGATLAIGAGVLAWKTDFLGFKTHTIEIVDKVKDKWQDMKESTSNLWSALKDAVTGKNKQMTNDVLLDVEEMKYGMKKKAEDSIKGITEAFNNGATDVKDAAYNLVKTGVDGVSSLYWNMYTSGQDLVKGLQQGMESKSYLVRKQSELLASQVQGYLGFSEPDVGPLSNFHTYMPDMLKLMAQGIYDNAYLVEDALGSLTGGMASSVNNMNYGGVNIILNVPQGANGQQIMDDIEQEIANRTIRRRAVFG